MLELSSGVEQSLRELRRPLDDVLLRKSMQPSQVKGGGAAGVLRNRIVTETCKPRLLATTRQGVISELVNALFENGFVADRARALQAVLDREQSLPTGLEYGVAMPHARTDAVRQLVCAVGLKKEGLEFGAADGRPTRIVVLVLAPEHAATPQLQVISELCRLLDEQGRSDLLACDTPEDMFGVLTGGEKTVPRRGRQMVLANCLAWQSIALDLPTSERAQVLTLLLALCTRSGTVGSLEEARKDVQVSSERPPVAIGESAVVFPVQTQSVGRMVAALGVSAREPVSQGGAPRVWVMVLYPVSAAAAYGEIEGVLKQLLVGVRLEALLAARNSREAFAVLTGV